MHSTLNHKEQTIKKYSIHYRASIDEALKLMDKNKCKLLIVEKENKFHNLLSIGDIQRGLLRKIELDKSIDKILRKRTQIKISTSEDSSDRVKELMMRYRMEFIPVINPDDSIKEVLFWNDIFDSKKRVNQRLKNVPVVIMAGGKGTRLKPLTNIIPKPLLPIGDKPILSEIIESFMNFGTHEFIISINHMGEIIKSYYNSNPLKGAELKFIQEKKPQGTAGSLYLLKNNIQNTFIVSNCDILIDQDFGEVYDFHKKSGNLITIVAALKNYSIPYGTLNIATGGRITSLSEKPKLNFVINTGVYVLEPSVLEFIPNNKFYHITHLIEDLMSKNKPVGIFPVSDGSWTDIGEFNSYFNLIKR